MHNYHSAHCDHFILQGLHKHNIKYYIRTEGLKILDGVGKQSNRLQVRHFLQGVVYSVLIAFNTFIQMCLDFHAGESEDISWPEKNVRPLLQAFREVTFGGFFTCETV